MGIFYRTSPKTLIISSIKEALLHAVPKNNLETEQLVQKLAGEARPAATFSYSRTIILFGIDALIFFGAFFAWKFSAPQDLYFALLHLGEVIGGLLFGALGGETAAQ